jgi:hypothetical protein
MSAFLFLLHAHLHFRYQNCALLSVDIVLALTPMSSHRLMASTGNTSREVCLLLFWPFLFMDRRHWTFKSQIVQLVARLCDFTPL